MSAKLVVAAALGAWLFLALLWPATCRTTQMGYPPGAPDINTTGCDGFFGQGLGSIREFEGGADVLLPQLRIRASVVTLAIVVVPGGRKVDAAPVPLLARPRHHGYRRARGHGPQPHVE